MEDTQTPSLASSHAQVIGTDTLTQTCVCTTHTHHNLPDTYTYIPTGFFVCVYFYFNYKPLQTHIYKVRLSGKAKEMAPWVKVFAKSEDLSLFPGTYINSWMQTERASTAGTTREDLPQQGGRGGPTAGSSPLASTQMWQTQSTPHKITFKKIFFSYKKTSKTLHPVHTSSQRSLPGVSKYCLSSLNLTYVELLFSSPNVHG